MMIAMGMKVPSDVCALQTMTHFLTYSTFLAAKKRYTTASSSNLKDKRTTSFISIADDDLESEDTDNDARAKGMYDLGFSREDELIF
jgi:hypothetical protein